MTEPRPPAPRHATIRQALADILRAGPASARELSQQVGIPEKAVAGHLAHLARSLPAHGERLTVNPPACLACGYTFSDRTRLSRPSRCPHCRGTHLVEPRFRIMQG
jgi:predicted Zn-ribbon and HTH transcriptional regulator